MTSKGPVASAFLEALPEPLTPARILASGTVSTRGPLPPLDLRGVSRAARILRHKRWLWVGLASDEVSVAFAIVRTGYAANAFVLVQDRAAKGLVAEANLMAAPWSAHVADDGHAPGTVASFRTGARSLAVVREGTALAIDVRVGDLRVDARLHEEGAPPPLAVVADLGEGAFDTTAKHVLLRSEGTVRVGGRTWSLGGGLGGYDFTSGFLPRHTRWRWAFGAGRDVLGARVAFNLTSGFVGGAECAAFDDAGPVPLGEPDIAVDLEAWQRPWTMRGEGVDLVFTPGGGLLHATRLGLVRSDFLQVLGTYDGTLRVGAREVRVAGLPGVAEHQDVLW